MNRIKSLLCMVLCVCLLASLAPLTVAAASTGACGENLTWKLDDAGVLTITGTGAMTDYADVVAPWNNEKDNIKKLILGEGVTSVGKNAFTSCTNLAEVEFPTTFKEIAPHGFYNCGFTTLMLPIGLEKIGEMAFVACYSLRDVTIPEGVTLIDDFAFEYCTALTTVKLPKSIEKMGGCVFRMCESLKNIYYAGSEENWNGTKIEKNWAHLAGDYTFHYNSINCDTQFLFTIGEKTVLVNGVPVENDVAPVVVNGRTMLPIRFLAEKLGLYVEWDGTTGRVEIIESTYRPNTTMVMVKNHILLVVGDNVVFVNSEMVPLDAPAFIQDGRTFLPVRFIAEALGCYVGWDEETQQVLIEKY